VDPLRNPSNRAALIAVCLSENLLIRVCYAITDPDRENSLKVKMTVLGNLRYFNTQSLKPLLPMYISTVDSGNLAGHLLTLRQGLLALPDCRILGARLFDGLKDTLRILVDTIEGAASAELAQLQKDPGYDSSPDTLIEAWSRLGRMMASAANLAGNMDADPENQAKQWAQRQSKKTMCSAGFLVVF
jgi:hypothetical protein